MSITTYAELQAAAANWLIRQDLTVRIPEFIQLAEARLNRVLRKRQGEVDRTLTATVGLRTIALPSDFSAAYNLWEVKTTGNVQLQRFMDPALLETSTTPREPTCWTIDGNNLAFECPCDSTYQFILHMLFKFALSTVAPTNSLLTDAPDVYLFATLAEAGPFLRDGELANAYESKLERAINELNALDSRSRSRQTLSTEPGQLNQNAKRFAYDITRDQ
jgi:hypothetical protein